MTWHLEPTDTATGRFPAGARDAVSRSGPRLCDCHGGPETDVSTSEAEYRSAVGSSPRVFVPVSTRQPEAQFRPPVRRLRLISPFQDG